MRSGDRRIGTRGARAIWMACTGIGVLYLGKALYRGLTFTRGDFYFTMPGEYARRLNPTLWNSPDLQQAIEFNRGAYLYGPTQYLTLFPVVFLPSYESIAAALLIVYPLVLLAAWVVLSRTLMPDAEVRRRSAPALFAMMFAFLPLTQALVQREFEVVAFLYFVVACWALVSGRDVAGGVVLAALAWFKYWPIILLGPLVLHRRVRALAGFAAGSAALLLAAHAAFGLRHFVAEKMAGIVSGLMRPLGSGEVLYPVIERGAGKSDFCRQWVWGRGTQADVRWALCGVEDRFPLLSAKFAFAAIIMITVAMFFWGVYRRCSIAPGTAEARWGGIWEFSIMAIVGVAFLHAHYYYLIVLLLPLGALLHRYLADRSEWRRVKLTMWGVTYFLLNAFIIPTTYLSSVLGRDAWALYLESGWCLAGTLLLLGLVLWEFAGGRPTVAGPLAAI